MAMRKHRWIMQVWRECSKPWMRLTTYPLSWRIANIHSDADTATPNENKQAPLQERKMVDRVRLSVRGGDGGSGCTSFRRSRHSRHGVADGGNGGKGGNIILECSSALWDFGNLQHHLILQVPVGTVIHLAKGSIPSVKESTILPDTAAWTDEDEMELEEKSSLTTSSDEQLQGCLGRGFTASTDAVSTKDNGEDEPSRKGKESVIDSNVAELVSPGDCLLVASGGLGGTGNAAIARGFGKEKVLPSLEHKPGQPGSEAVLILELKTIADVGLVGLPNAGKSTLLGAISRAKPKIGHYAFTTLRPNIGRVVFDDYFALTVADIPGLIQGAHEDNGLGFAFLRHIERTTALAFVLDLSAALADDRGIPPWDQLEQLKFELEKYQPGLLNRPSLVVANKIDEDGAEEVLNELRRRLPLMQVYPVCAVLEEGISRLKWGLRMLVEDSSFHAITIDNVDIIRDSIP
ncbi:hypothetical protein O6H91_19G076000 [Diphasiastrum complanatum]|uniref:Uncharacterized protein n=1 Tax=Diphasiastrum complanatum TaxID=34168 RepID=A0ACC2AWW1_DIPCM|nr:hypothetical protein O6H91_19G076000 [Diphasiastrum complanatum]